MSASLILQRIRHLCALLIGLVLVWFSVQKLSDPAGFLKAIHTYEMLPEQPPWLLNIISIWIPWLELSTGLCIILNLARRPAALVSCAMLFIFTSAIVLRALEAHNNSGQAFCEIAFDCGCGTGVVNICTKLVENILMITATAFIAFTPEDFPATSFPSTGTE